MDILENKKTVVEKWKLWKKGKVPNRWKDRKGDDSLHMHIEVSNCNHRLTEISHPKLKNHPIHLSSSSHQIQNVFLKHPSVRLSFPLPSKTGLGEWFLALLHN